MRTRAARTLMVKAMKAIVTIARAARAVRTA
jgi:hypothetical protein